MDKGNQSYQRFLAGDKQGLVEIMELYSDRVCESGVFLDIIFEYGAETGVGIAMGEWSEEKMVVLGY